MRSIKNDKKAIEEIIKDFSFFKFFNKGNTDLYLLDVRRNTVKYKIALSGISSTSVFKIYRYFVPQTFLDEDEILNLCPIDYSCIKDNYSGMLLYETKGVDYCLRIWTLLINTLLDEGYFGEDASVTFQKFVDHRTILEVEDYQFQNSFSVMNSSFAHERWYNECLFFNRYYSKTPEFVVTFQIQVKYLTYDYNTFQFNFDLDNGKISISKIDIYRDCLK